MKNRQLLGTVALLLCWAFSACKFDDYVVEKPFIPLSEEMKSYFTFANEGSLFIYRDSASGDIDSTIISRKDDATFGGRPYIGEMYNIWYQSTKTQDFRAIVSTNEEWERMRILFTVGTELMIRWDKETQSFTQPSNTYRLIDSVNLHGQIYRDVLEIQGDLEFNRLWYAKNVGIILKDVSSVVTQDSTFELIDYQLK